VEEALAALTRAADRGNGNLLAAALEAGFGSYTQFHRVYKRMFGTCPREQRAAASVTTLRSKPPQTATNAAKPSDS